MTYKETLESIPNYIKAPNFDGDIREVLAKHKGYLQGESWGVRAALRNANLQNSNLENANLQNSNLENANLQNSNLENANLRNSDLENADLENADLQNANLENANLENAKDKNGRVLKIISIRGAYEYAVLVFVYKDRSVWIRMGCLFKSLGSWCQDGFWESNPREFKDDGSFESNQRKLAFEFAKATAKNMVESVDWENI